MCIRDRIGEELIKNKVALKTTRDINIIKDTLSLVAVNYHKSDYIEKNWSWKHHVKLWEEMFNEIVSSPK